jgi:antitoxin component of RelBE/YafQ-DinJ toxin-antitoxin module
MRKTNTITVRLDEKSRETLKALARDFSKATGIPITISEVIRVLIKRTRKEKAKS